MLLQAYINKFKEKMSKIDFNTNKHEMKIFVVNFFFFGEILSYKCLFTSFFKNHNY